jgi:hypothetical protein
MDHEAKLAYLKAVATGLSELRYVFSKDDDWRKLFDEFIREYEFELALHVICDYLLEPEIQIPHDSILEKISSLHSTMQVEDDCLTKLRAKKDAG